MSEIKEKTAQAWIAKIHSKWISIGWFEMKMLLEKPKIISVIGAPKHFQELILFKENLFPLVQLNTLLGLKKVNKSQDSENSVIGIVTYYNLSTNSAEHGAIQFDNIPRHINVTNELQIDLDQSKSPLKEYSKTLFQYENEKIHVLDLNKIFNLT
jgi:chemotaxis signal transduction protein